MPTSFWWKVSRPRNSMPTSRRIRSARPHGRARSGPEHLLRPGVVGCQTRFPASGPSPAGLIEYRVRRNQKLVGVDQAAAAHTAAVQYRHVSQECEHLDSVKAELRQPDALFKMPIGGWEILGAVPAALFEHRHTISFFCQAQGPTRCRRNPSRPRSRHNPLAWLLPCFEVIEPCPVRNRFCP